MMIPALTFVAATRGTRVPGSYLERGSNLRFPAVSNRAVFNRQSSARNARLTGHTPLKSHAGANEATAPREP
jgi:hypothetical protein